MTSAQIDTLKVGSIVRTPRSFRVVRAVTHRAPYKSCYPPRGSFVFTILHRSWTGKCYTVLNRSDLLNRRYQPTTGRMRLTDKLSRAIARDIDETSRKKHKLSPDDVRGIR